MRLGSYHYRPNLALTLASLVIIITCLRLGMWQLSRADEKAALAQALADHIAAAPLALQATPPADLALRYRRVRVRGTFDPERQILLDNQILQGRPGYHVLTLLRIADGGGGILVNRGWTSGGPDRNYRPQPPVPAGPVEIAGRLDFPSAKPFGMNMSKGSDWGWRWPYLDLTRFKEQSGVDTGPFILLQEMDATDSSLVRNWPLPDYSSHRHTAYAIQWFAFAVIASIIYCRLSFSAGTSPE